VGGGAGEEGDGPAYGASSGAAYEPADKSCGGLIDKQGGLPARGTIAATAFDTADKLGGGALAREVMDQPTAPETPPFPVTRPPDTDDKSGWRRL
jgi:hypothetical protein